MKNTETLPTYDDIANETFHSQTEQVADFTATWPNGNEPDGETQVAVKVHGSVEAGGFILTLDDNDCGGSSREAGETIYPTFEDAQSAAKAYAKEHGE
jgi:hypothetical protein